MRIPMQWGLFAGVAAWMVGAGAAGASTITNTFTDLTSWQNAVAGETTITFLAGSTAGGSYTEPSSYTLDGVTFSQTPSTQNVTIQDTGSSAPSWYQYGIGWALFSMSSTVSNNPQITVTPSAGTSALSFYLATQSSYGEPVLVTFSDGSQYTLSAPSTTLPVPLFFGVTSSAPLTSLSFTLAPGDSLANSTRLILGDVAEGTSNPVSDTPEVATFILIGTGLAAMRLFGRKALA